MDFDWTRSSFYANTEAYHKLIETQGLDPVRFLPTTRDVVEELCTEIKFYEPRVTGVMSVGCGSGSLEWLMEEFFPRAVTVVELDSNLLAEHVRRKDDISKLFVDGRRFVGGKVAQIPQVPDGHALLFCWGTLAPWWDYVAQLQVVAVVIIGDNTCVPFANKESDQELLEEAGFVECHRDDRRYNEWVGIWRRPTAAEAVARKNTAREAESQARPQGNFKCEVCKRVTSEGTWIDGHNSDGEVEDEWVCWECE